VLVCSVDVGCGAGTMIVYEIGNETLRQICDCQPLEIWLIVICCLVAWIIVVLYSLYHVA
jgi:hypothetical protein